MKRMCRRNFVSVRRCGRRRRKTGKQMNLPRQFVKKFLAVFAAACVVSTADAQEARFEATLDRNPVSLGEQFTLSFTLTNAGSGGGKNLQLPELSKFHIMAGPNQSSSMQFINGAVSSSITYSYVLQPKEVGKFTIGPASVEAAGKTLKTV